MGGKKKKRKRDVLPQKREDLLISAGKTQKGGGGEGDLILSIEDHKHRGGVEGVFSSGKSRKSGVRFVLLDRKKEEAPRKSFKEVQAVSMGS